MNTYKNIGRTGQIIPASTFAPEDEAAEVAALPTLKLDGAFHLIGSIVITTGFGQIIPTRKNPNLPRLYTKLQDARQAIANFEADDLVGLRIVRIV